jgi:hypothetical protein
VTLAIRLGTEHQINMAVRFKADLGAFAGRTTRGLEKARNAEPAQPAMLRRDLTPRCKPVA